jgi:hypothetical protein
MCQLKRVSCLPGIFQPGYSQENTRTKQQPHAVTAAWIFKLFGRMKRGVIHYYGRVFGYRFDELRPEPLRERGACRIPGIAKRGDNAAADPCRDHIGSLKLPAVLNVPASHSPGSSSVFPDKRVVYPAFVDISTCFFGYQGWFFTKFLSRLFRFSRAGKGLFLYVKPGLTSRL